MKRIKLTKTELDFLSGMAAGILLSIIIIITTTDVIGTVIDVSPRIEAINNTVILKNHLNQTLSLNCASNGSATLTTTIEVNDTSTIDYAKINDSINHYFIVNTDTFNASKCIIDRETFLSSYNNKTQTLIEKSDASMQAYFTETILPKQKDIDTLKDQLKDCGLQKEHVEGKIGNMQSEINNSKELRNLCLNENNDYKYAFYGIVGLILLGGITLFGGLRFQKKKLSIGDL